ncbi:MAG TPA: acyl-CoA dehydrogenase family protein [Woeseiaceae bacterium]
MQYRNPVTNLESHHVDNQPPPFEGLNRYTSDRALVEAVGREGAGFAEAGLIELGERVGSAEVQDQATQADRHPPELRAFDRFGRRIDEVEFHPAYHALMRLGLESGVCSIAWTAASGGHAAHAALLYLMTTADAGVCCPFSMTYASVPVLRREPELAAAWEPGVTAARYDPGSRPAAEKAGVTIGMAMTEKQGGSDVRANTTRARALAGRGEYELVGHKWFCSAPMSDAFFTLAQTGAGLTCFLVPRWRPDGSRNALRIMRLKDKLGDRSNASAEIEYHGAWARLVGDEGQGVRTIIEMVQGTRLDCVVGSAALMRNALAGAIWHCAHRSAFGRKLIYQPAMMKVLADLALEQEAALALAFRVARAFDEANPGAVDIARVLTPIAKYWVCKRTPSFVCEAMECHGGNGYVEESPLPRYLRQSPLNSIWEGSGNVIALDVLRAIQRQPALLDALLGELQPARGLDPRLDRVLAGLPELARTFDAGDARRFCEWAGLAFQAALLVVHAPTFVADAFVATRFEAAAPHSYGAFACSVDCMTLIERAFPGPPPSEAGT